MKNHLLLTTILCGCSLTAWSAMPIEQPWQTITMAEEVTPEAPTSEAVIDVNTTTGTFVSKNSNGTWASAWKSTQTSPFFNLTCGANNMDVAKSVNGDIVAYVGNQTNSCDYMLSVERGWKITGYSFDFVRVSGKNPVTLTDAKGTALKREFGIRIA